MRLSELAKELETTPRNLIVQAKGLGLLVSTYGSELRKKDEAKLREGYRRRSSIEVADDEAALRHAIERKKIAAATLTTAKVANDAEVLRSAAKHAKSLAAKRPGAATENSAICNGASAQTAKAAKPRKAETVESEPVDVSEKIEIVETPAPMPEPAPALQPSTASLPPSAPPPPPVGGMLPVRNWQAPRETLDTLKQPSKLVQKVAREVQKATARAVKEAEAAAKAAPAVVASPENGPFAAASPSRKGSEKSTLTPLPKRPPRAMHPIDEEEDDVAMLSGKITRVVKATPTSGKVAGGRPKRGEDARPSLSRDRRSGRDSLPARGSAVSHTAPLVSQVENGVLKLHANVLVKELADKLGLRPNAVIQQLMKLGVMASINQCIDFATASKICAINGVTAELEKSKRTGEHKPVIKNPEDDDEIPEDRPDQLRPRPPVVAFFGHVDHGKTSIMDRIRSANVAKGEAGGITQHISAYTVDVNGRQITFLDTPGHAAFSSMRARGATLTDIAIIIIAADDGIMEQTKEAIRHARESGVTIMVAINKIDLPTANAMRVMQQLQAENLTPEEWGGDTVVCQISAATGDGIGNLLDMILLQADVLELKANPDRRADGIVIEAEMRPGSGPSANILITGGTLKVGDAILCGEQYGKIRAIIDSTGRRVRTVSPSQAGTLIGLSGVPEAGEEFRVMLTEKRARELAAEYAEAKKIEALGAVTQARSIDDIFKKMRETEKIALSVVIRADVQGSVEAVVGSIQQIKSDKVSVEILQSGTGAITANDVQRAAGGKAVVVGFNVNPESGVLAESRHYGVRIKTFRIIYELLDYIKNEMLELLPVAYKEVVRGHALVRQVFSLGKVGVAAGSAVQDGVIITGAKARVMRKGKLVHSGDIATIRHYKDEVKEINAGQECGILLADFTDFEVGDIIECFVFEELPKEL